jgi:beta-N-acetylhexosaminidase
VTLLVVAAATGCGHAARTAASAPARSTPAATSTGALPPAPSHHAVRRKTLEQRLSPAQLAGQRIIYAYAGLTPPASLLRAIRAGQAAGVIFFGPNISSVDQLHGVVGELQRAAASSPVHAPLLLMTDQEGGEVRRLPGPPALSEKQIGEGADPVALARDAGAGAGRALAAAGLNVNLAPVLDVYRRPGNFIDRYQRSYSSDPGEVATLAGSFISAQQEAGVAATAKHFPGLGAAAAGNTDQELVTLEVSLERLRAVDEAPYRSAIAAGVELVMISWALYPVIDGQLPAGLSPAVIGRELRGRLGFRGVTITDAISAGALGRFGVLGRRGVLAAGAGADLILCAATNPDDNSPSLGLAVLHALTASIDRGRIPRAGAERAVARVLSLRAHL